MAFVKISLVKGADREQMNFGDRDFDADSPKGFNLAQEEIENDY